MTNNDTEHEPAPFEGIRIIDLATVFAGPMAAAFLGDYGADVIKIEHPRGDPARNHGHRKSGIPLWWKVVGRNKRTAVADVSQGHGRELLRSLAARADVLIENFRPGTLERWDLDPVELIAKNPRLIVLRVSGFGQTGPYRSRPGFGTIAEAMSGLAHVTGFPDGPPVLPSLGLADAFTGITGAFAVATALFERERSGRGQIIDLSIAEPILHTMGAQAINYQQLGIVQGRTGNRSFSSAPRNAYLTRDGAWLAVSTSALPIAQRVMRLVGFPHYIDEPWFQTGEGRAAHADELDNAVGSWIAARDAEDAITEFEAAEAAIARINDIHDVLNDPQYRHRQSYVEVDDSDLGTALLPNLPYRLSRTPGSIRWAGRRLGEDQQQVEHEAANQNEDAL